MRLGVLVLALVAACASPGESAREGAGAAASSGATLTSAALAAPAPVVPEPVAVRVLFVGDAIPHRGALSDGPHLASAIAPLAPLFGAADGVVASCESATGDAPRAAKRYAAEPAWLKALADAHVTAIAAATDHACDLGPAGLDATLHTASRAGLVAVGADATDPWAARVVAEKQGKRVCAVAWTTEPAGEACAGTLAVAAARKGDAERDGATGSRTAWAKPIERALAKARAAGCDGVVAIVHGVEDRASAGAARRQARRAAEAGADAVILVHPHTPGEVAPMTTQDGRRVPVFQSLGDLVADPTLGAWARLGVVADLVLTFDGASVHPAAGWGFHLTWTEAERGSRKKGRETSAVHPITRLVDPASDEALLTQLAAGDDGPLELFSSPCLLAKHPSHCN